MLVGLVLFVTLAAVLIVFVPLADCPGHEFEETPPYICVRCGDTLRVTLFKRWRLAGWQKTAPTIIKGELIIWTPVTVRE